MPNVGDRFYAISPECYKNVQDFANGSLTFEGTEFEGLEDTFKEYANLLVRTLQYSESENTYYDPNNSDDSILSLYSVWNDEIAEPFFFVLEEVRNCNCEFCGTGNTVLLISSTQKPGSL